MSSPVLSIVIPTRNRYQYLYYCLLSLIQSFEKLDIEIIINDNSTDVMPDDLFDLIEKNSSILVYNKIEGWYSQVGNFENAFGLAKGEYLTMIGDDDSLLPEIMHVIELMKINNLDAVNALFATYLWPDVESRVFSKDKSGVLTVPKFNSKLSFINLSKEVDKLLKCGGTNLGNLPRLYYGVVKGEVLKKVKENCGVFFPGPSPDMANAVSMSFHIEKFAHYDNPIFIAGNSAKSAAGMGAKGDHQGNLDKILSLPKDCSKDWSKYIPKFWSGPTIWAESAIKAIKATKNEKLLQKFNYLNVIASCYVFNSNWRNEIDIALNTYIQEKGTNRVQIHLLVNYYKMKIWFKRGLFFLKNLILILKNKYSKTPGNVNIDNVYLAVSILEKMTKK